MRANIKYRPDKESNKDHIYRIIRLIDAAHFIKCFHENKFKPEMISRITGVEPDDFTLYLNLYDALEHNNEEIILHMIRSGLTDELILKCIPQCDPERLCKIRTYEELHHSEKEADKQKEID